jgi:parallel beta-helix repeat protein
MKNHIFVSIVLLHLCFAISNGLYATTYYISGSLQGNDINNGTSQSTPWKTITKLNSANLQPGDSALFECGYVYRGQINAKPGAIGNPVYYGSYGTGAKPAISGAIQLQNSGWSVYQGNIYVKSNVIMPSMAVAEPPNLFVNGQLMIPARYPNNDYLKADNVNGQNPGSNCCELSYSLQHGFLSSVFANASDLQGAHITGYDPYGVSSRLVNSYLPASGTLNFDTLRGIGFISSKLYFLSRKLNLLDAPGEWFYDASQQKLYVWMPNNSAPTANDTIEYSYYSYGISDWQVPYITVKDLEFRYQQIAGIWVIRSNGVTISDNRFYESKYGIHGWGSSSTYLAGTVITNNSFENIHRIAINLNNYIDNALISENDIQNISRHNALMQSGVADQWGNYGYYDYGIGIKLQGVNSIISLNKIDSTGREAITAGGTGVWVSQNVMNCPCFNYNDCGGIMPLGNSTVDKNIIKNSYGYFPPGYTSMGARGIYPDFRTGDIITNNTIVNTVIGIGLTNSKNTTIRNNTVYNASFAQFRMNRKDAGQLNNTIKGNIFFGLTHEQNSLIWDNQVTGIDNNSILDSNRYWNPYSYYPLIKYRSDGTLGENWYDLVQWQSTGKDLNSIKEFKFKNQPYVINDTTGSSLTQNGSFDSGTTGWNNTPNMVFTTITGQLDGACASVTYNGVYTGTISQNIAQTFLPDSLYMISFSLKGTLNTNGEPLEVKLVETGNNSGRHFYRAFKNQTVRQDYWSVFKAQSSSPLTIQFVAPNGTYYIDNIQIHPVNADWVNPESVFPIFINETSSQIMINLPPCSYLDLDSNQVGTSLTLPPFSSQILVLDTCLLTSLSEQTHQTTNNLSVYPSPASSNVTIGFFVKGGNTVHLNVLDLHGRQVLSLVNTPLAKGNHSISFNTSELKAGMYSVLYWEGNHLTTQKLLIVH